MILKTVHILLALGSFGSFAGRLALSEFRPEKLSSMWSRIAPPILDTALLGSGIALALHNGWFSPVAPWLLAKLLALSAYIAFGVAAMRLRGQMRSCAFAAAVCCFGYIVAAALSKNPLLFR